MALVTLLLLVLFEVASFLIFKTQSILTQNSKLESTLNKPLKPNHTQEQSRAYAESKALQKYDYKAFIGWQARPADGEFVNINSERRRVTNFEGYYSDAPTLHMFGGSTMWGSGVSDGGTIPALLAPKIGYNLVNYGDRGYNSRQGLNRLIDSLEDISDVDTVVFYDGVNDAMQNCRSDNSPNGHSREGQLKFLLEDHVRGTFGNSFKDLIRRSNSYKMLNKLSQKFDRSGEPVRSSVFSRCDDPAVAQEVAEFLVQNWRVTEDILQARNIQFVCALQPNPYTATKFTPAYYMKERAISVQAVYPKVKALAQQGALGCFVDMTDIFEKDYYLDNCCHVNRAGNEVIAEAFKRILDERP